MFGSAGREVNTYVLSGLCSLRERDVYDHLEHIRKSVGKQLVIVPAECAVCHYVFNSRSRLAPPSKCPKCHSEQIESPMFKIVEKDGNFEPPKSYNEVKGNGNQRKGL